MRPPLRGAQANLTKKKNMNKEQLLRHIMAIIYRNGHWSNQSEKINDILLLVHSEIENIEESAESYNNRNRIS